ncbi:MAG: FRG domain-containing protein [Lewinellaceae bacterium]|nr:FRG domain-containing protein [Lewinellaceae bacterium]
MIHQAADLREALEMALELKRRGEADWFRGQSRNWPLLSSLNRHSDEAFEAAANRLANFMAWLKTIPVLQPIAENEWYAMAVAQHYGIPTHLIDFTTEPPVAAFFATPSTSSRPPEVQEACIICLNTAEFDEFREMIRAVKPEWPDPERVVVDIRELWRIDAQKGAFIYYPFDEGFEKHWFGFDRIVFPAHEPANAAHRPIPEANIYPTQKSDLEILLDQYFMNELRHSGQQELSGFVPDGNTIHYDGPPDGIERECFGPDGLPPHDSWRITHRPEWVHPVPEQWTEITRAPEIRVLFVAGPDPVALGRVISVQLEHEFSKHPGIRATPLRWKLEGFDFPEPATATEIENRLALLWDGLRRWPYETADIAAGLANAAIFGWCLWQQPHRLSDGSWLDMTAEKCLGGDSVKTEIAMPDGSYSRGYARCDALHAAVRCDFPDYLSERYRGRIHTIHQILQIAPAPTGYSISRRWRGYSPAK